MKAKNLQLNLHPSQGLLKHLFFQVIINFSIVTALEHVWPKIILPQSSHRHSPEW